MIDDVLLAVFGSWCTVVDGDVIGWLVYGIGDCYVECVLLWVVNCYWCLVCFGD